jgi:undecaprenyl-diphosphatase
MPYDAAVRSLEPGARRSAVVATALVVLVFLAAAWVVRGGVVSDVDRDAKALIRDGRPAILETPMRVISVLATGYVLLPVTLVASVALWWRRRQAVALWLPALGIVAVLVLPGIKWLISVPRPTLRGHGFPSGHVFAATLFVVVAVYLLWSLGVPRRWQRAARAAGIVFVTLVGYSRIYVNAHWLSDVVGGLLAGTAFALLVVLVIDGRLRPTAKAPPHPDRSGSSAPG